MKKALVGLCAAFVCIPLMAMLAFRAASGLDAMGILILFWFLLYPALFVGFGVVVGICPKRTWPVPVLAAALFPPFFWPVIGEVVWDLYAYAALYLGFAAPGAAPVLLARYLRALKRR